MNPYRILIVDDDRSMTRLIAARLSMSDSYEVSVASSGQQALDEAPQWRPDLILLDWVMPQISGINVLRELKAHTALQHTKIVMLSARNLIGELEHAFELGADGFIVKPFQLDTLVNKIDAALTAQALHERDDSSAPPWFEHLKKLI